MVRCLFVCLVGRSIGRSVGWLLGWLLGSLVSGLDGSLVSGLDGSLVRWLDGSLSVRFRLLVVFDWLASLFWHDTLMNVTTITSTVVTSTRHQFRDPEEKRSQRYLTKEFVDVLTERPVKYKLQMQLHQTTADQSHLILHPGRAWAPDTHPWIDVADVSLTTPLPPEVVQRCWAEVAYSHPTLQACTEPGTIHAYGLPGRALRHLPGLQAGGARPGADNLFPTKKYVVQVETGDRHGSGTDAIISIVMIGNWTIDEVFFLSAIPILDHC